tara:strand:+ start:938 stop:1345 length:408 start_codon:yes stop_codon:yes gene_type:complete
MSNQFYKTLNDAVKTNELFAAGFTEIWYVKNEETRDMTMGAEWLAENDKLPTRETLKNTHALLGRTSFTDNEEAFMSLQGEVWSPEGEANELILGLGCAHTSMSVGDIIIDKIHDQAFIVDDYGFYSLNALGDEF